MWLKILIIINFVLLVISLFSSLFFVYKERGEGNMTFTLLCVRVGLAVSLILLVGFGIASGKIGHYAPWDNQSTIPNQQH